jgi:Zn-dependent protease with chaperone function
VARKSKATKRKTQSELTPRDYRFPGETRVYWTAVLGLVIVFVWIVSMFLIFKRQASGLLDLRWAYLFLWPIGSIFLANYLSAKPRIAELKRAGRQARVMSSNQPDLFSAFLHNAQLLGLKTTPDLHIVTDDAAYIFSIPGRPGSIIASRPLQNALTQDEFMALISRELGSLAAHNVRVGLALTWIQTANIGLKILLLPLFLMSLLMGGWEDLAEFTADRAGALLSGESTMNLALLKLAIARDPQADINQDDLEAYLRGNADISADSKQLERHFRIGSFIEDQPNLRERIEQIGDYRKSDQGTAAHEKLAALRGAAR